GWAALAAIIYGAVVVMTQTFYAIAEPHQIYCSEKPEDMTAELKLDTPCTSLGVRVQRGHSYRVTVAVKGAWKDDAVPADPQHGTDHETVWMKIGHPLKRMTNANWLQPVTEVRAEQTGILRYVQWLVGKD